MRELYDPFSLATGPVRGGSPALCRFLFCALLLLCDRGLFAQTIVLDGKSDWEIVVPQGASRTVVFAAEELKRYVAEMTGVSLEVREPRASRGHSLIVGNYEQVGRSADLPSRFARSHHPEGYTIVAGADAVWITGQTDGATLRAVYVFLDSLGGRFLSPQFDFYQGAGEVIPKSRTLRLSGALGMSEPKLRFRKLYVESGIHMISKACGR
jgi:hypothetical protein